MTITGQSSLNKDEIDRMVRDAEAHAAEDRQRKEEADVRNNADSLVYQTEKLLKDQGDKLIGDERDRLESSLKEVKDALGGSDIEAIRRSTDGLMTASQTFAQRLYEQAAQDQPAGGTGPSGGPADEEVVDAEIVDEERP